jgi:hypothetical protein
MAAETATNYVPKSLFDAYTIIYATSDNTPAALTVNEQKLIGRDTGGSIAGIGLATGLSIVSGDLTIGDLSGIYEPIDSTILRDADIGVSVADQGEVDDLVTLSGVASGSTTMGTFTGTTLTDNQTTKALFQEVEMAIEDTVTLSGDTEIVVGSNGVLSIGSTITRDTEWDTWAEHPALSSGYLLIGNGSNQPAASNTIPEAVVFVDGDATGSLGFVFDTSGARTITYPYDASITLGRKIISAQTLTTAGFDVEITDTNTVFACTIAGLTDNRAAVLPVATGSGVLIEFLVIDGDDTYDFRVDPDGTDQIITTSAAGDYLGADDAGDYIELVDVASGKWAITSKQGTWTEE